jgi:hypothetical protein
MNISPRSIILQVKIKGEIFQRGILFLSLRLYTRNICSYVMRKVITFRNAKANEKEFN